MRNIRFTLRNIADKKKLQSIYIVYNFDSNKKIMYSTGFLTKLDYWNKKSQRITATADKNKDIVNNSLNEIKTISDKFLIECKHNKTEVTKEVIKKFFNEYFTPSLKEKNSNSLFSFIENFITKSQTRINPKTGKHISYKTIREYERTLYFLKEYEKISNEKLTFSNIDKNFYDAFLDYLQTLNLATNTIGHKILTLKTFLNDATDRGINTNLAFKKFRIVKETVKNEYLNESELKKILEYDFSNNKRLETVRDIFVFASYTGMRFDDIKQINYEIQKEYILNTQFKTGNNVKIPILKITREILDKYNNKLPKVISNQKFNDYLKEICRIVGITETVKKTQTKGGVKETKKLEKWQRIGTHTARRSFATNSYLMKIPSITIMQITGHKTETAFLKYIQVTTDQHADLLKSIWENKNN